jgi:hypothetical protein
MELNEFMFRDKMPGISDEQLASVCEIVNIMFSGVNELWSILDEDTRNAKRRLLFSYLVAWQLCNLYPDYMQGVSSSGGLPLLSKSINDIHLTYKDMARQEGSNTELLQTNVFGINALFMIQSAPETFMLTGGM